MSEPYDGAARLHAAGAELIKALPTSYAQRVGFLTSAIWSDAYFGYRLERTLPIIAELLEEITDALTVQARIGAGG